MRPLNKEPNAEKKSGEEDYPTTYQRKEVEKKWQDYWEEHEVYKFEKNSNRPIFSIDNPPRYASGKLHAGHAVHYTHIDFAARHHRMKGYNVHFPLCFDVNGIPIEERVERLYNVSPKTVGRQEFNKMCMNFALKNIEEMTRQFKILGHSMDPSVFYQTASKEYRRLTQISFIRLFKKGLIYKGSHPVNWCPRCHTALADAEVEYKKKMSKINTIKFKVEDITSQEKERYGEYINIATTRPELLCTCHLVAVHPEDTRYKWLVGKKVTTPVFDRTVPVVADEKVDPHFGSGIVMICTIGDKDDLSWALKYKLPIEMAIDEDGKMTEQAGPYKGMKIEEAREKIIEDMRKDGSLLDSKPIEQQAGVCWRCSTVIEFLKKPQWFLKTLPFKEKVLAKAQEVRWFPGFMKIRLQEWVNSLEWDWVISRQRYFATPIPLWECEKCGEVVLAKEEDCYVDPTLDPPPVERCPGCGEEAERLKGCEDVFDTWMDSSITPLYNCFWLRDEKMFKKMFPSSLRPQSHDIIRTWAFYTLLRSYLLTGKRPWDNIMMDGFILSPDGTPMHTSKGNVIDPLDALERYGAEALRYYAATCAVGSDNAFRWKDLVRGERFIKKFWNLQRFIGKSLKIAEEKGINYRELNLTEKNVKALENRWILSLFSQVVKKAVEAMDNYRFDKALKEVEYFLWHELADDYVEMVKHRIYTQKEEEVFACLYNVGIGLAKLLAPLFPHVTEEVNYLFYAKDKENYQSIHNTSYPDFVFYDEKALKKGKKLKEVIKAIRSYKSEKGLALNAEIEKVMLLCAEEIREAERTIQKTVNARTLEFSGKEAVAEVVVGFVPDFTKIGPLFKKRAQEVGKAIKEAKVEMPVEEFESLEEFVFVLEDGEEMKVPKDCLKPKKRFVSRAGEEGEMLSVSDVGIFVMI